MRIEVLARAEPLEIDEARLRDDLEGELRDLARELEGLGAEEAEAGVYRRLVFLLCGPCQVAYLRQPLGPDPAKAE